MKMNKQNGHGLNPKGENPAKFLREMEVLIPALKRKGVIPMGREEARLLGEKSATAMGLKKEAEHKRRMAILGRRLDEYMLELAPWTFRLMVLTGWTWLIPFMGYDYQIEATTEEVQGCPGVPCTRVTVLWRWCRWATPKVLKAERLVWEEPKPPKVPKTRIIRP